MELEAGGNRRVLVRVRFTQGYRYQWACRIEYLDDGSEDRASGFMTKELADRWAATVIRRHFDHGTPGRLS